MSPPRVTTVDLWGWRGFRLASGAVALVVTPEIGGRVSSLTLDGDEVLFTLPTLRGHRIPLDGIEDVRAKKRELGFLHYGGYKTWLAPQARWTDGLPFLDLDSGPYVSEVEERDEEARITLTSPVCRETGVQLTRTIAISASGRIMVDQGMINRSSATAAWGLWDVTQIRGPGWAVLPVNPRSRFPGGVKAYPNEGRSLEVMDRYVLPRDGIVIVTCAQSERFKYGTDSHEGWILALLDRRPGHWLACLKVFRAMPGAGYAHDSVVEVYDSSEYPYFEVEAHSPLQHLAPGADFLFLERWVLEWVPKAGSPGTLRQWIDGITRQDLLAAAEPPRLRSAPDRRGHGP